MVAAVAILRMYAFLELPFGNERAAMRRFIELP